MPSLLTTLSRPNEIGDLVKHDVAIEYSADCIMRATRDCWDDAGFPAEFECQFKHAAFVDPTSPADPLSGAELDTLRDWFLRHAPDPAPPVWSDHEFPY
jgi:hypothetical protein